ncbi:MAG: hypothetical protein IPM77_09475 [Crocinitomicaceae bacterium]|nr:hypothetical protein [Crocinitomicaceae bacterium]
MKKMILAVAVIGGITMLASCKKDHVCSCSGTILGIPFSGVDTTYTDMTKKEATTECDKNDASVGTDNIDCELK